MTSADFFLVIDKIMSVFAMIIIENFNVIGFVFEKDGNEGIVIFSFMNEQELQPKAIAEVEDSHERLC